MEENKVKNNEKKKIKILIILVVTLFLVVVGLCFYIAVDKNMFSSESSTIEKPKNNEDDSSYVTDAKEGIINTSIDLDEVTKEIETNLSKYVNMAIGPEIFSSNLLEKPDYKLYLVNYLLQQQGKNSYYNDGQGFPYVEYNTYKAQYEKVYGTSNDLDSILNNENSIGTFLTTDDYEMGKGYVGWMENWHGSNGSRTTTLKANKVYKSSSSNNNVIEGTFVTNDSDGSTVVYNGNFKLEYNRTTTNQPYIISLILTNN